jgi:hypothetical protein
MTIGTPVNVTATGTASGTSIASGAVGKLANERLLVAVTIRNPSAYVDPGITDSDGLSWTLIETIDGPASNPFMRTKIWGCNDAAARGSMTIMGTAPAANAIALHPIRVPADNPLDFSSVSENSNGTGIATIAATVPGSPAAIITYAVSQSSGAWTHPTNYTELGDLTLASNSFRSAWAYDLASPGNPVSWQNANMLAKNLFVMDLKETTSGTTVSCGNAPATAVSNALTLIRALILALGVAAGTGVSNALAVARGTALALGTSVVSGTSYALTRAIGGTIALGTAVATGASYAFSFASSFVASVLNGVAGFAENILNKLGLTYVDGNHPNADWRQVAEALEDAAGLPRELTQNEVAYIHRAAAAYDVIAGTSGADLRSRNAHKKRLIDAMEAHAATTTTGSLDHRLRQLSESVPL